MAHCRSRKQARVASAEGLESFSYRHIHFRRKEKSVADHLKQHILFCFKSIQQGKRGYRGGADWNKEKTVVSD